MYSAATSCVNLSLCWPSPLLPNASFGVSPSNRPQAFRAMSERMPRPVALITGGAKRIGNEIARTLAHKGWNIALHYRSSSDEAEETLRELDDLGGHHCILQADLAQESQTRAMFALAESRLGRVDAVINNAALFDYDDAHSFNSHKLNAHIQPNLAAP